MITFEAVIETIRTGRTSEQIDHRGIPDILEAAHAIETAFMPVFATGLDEAPFGLQCQNRPGTGRTVGLRATAYRETLPT
jgi:hypothetical protein